MFTFTSPSQTRKVVEPGKVLPGSAGISPYLDRVISPDETLEHASRLFDRLGITRVADQTRLDRIGIHCFAAFRPNGKTIANNQGKGLTKTAAKASAVMEAVEFAVAEQPQISTLSATASDLVAKGCNLIDIRTLLPIGHTIPTDKKIRWVAGYNLLTREEVHIPLDAVSMDAKNSDLSGICKTTNGLASGNNLDEAIFHGLCELIERDAGSLWSLMSEEERAFSAIDPDTWQDTEVNKLLLKIKCANLQVRLFDQTSDIGVPCVMAVIGKSEQTRHFHFELASGYGAHPNADRAAIRAITEAAQTRITSIAGSRDDIDPGRYSELVPTEHQKLLETKPISGKSMTSGFELGMPLEDLLAATVVATLATSHADGIFVFPLCGDEFDVSVVKIIVPFLEDRDVNANWRPKLRALKFILKS
jgi:YcaO-like protein with predicted kinase domain